jgi:nucleoside-diphosphate-sugar epimerase
VSVQPAEQTSRDKSHPRLVIFGCGYVGSAVAVEALRRGWSVTALTRNHARSAELEAMGVRAVCADLAHDEWHAGIPHEQDFVLNCVSSGGGGLEGYWRSYVEGTRSIIEWARHGCAATYVYTGSTSVYPQGNGERVEELSPVGGGSEASAPLLEAERLAREAHKFSRWFILRLAGIYGPGRHYLLDQLRAGATLFPGTGTHRLNLIYLDDIVAAIFACFDAPAPVRDAVFNVADDYAAPKQEVAAWLAAQIGCAEPAFAHDKPARPVDGIVVRGRSGPVPDRVIDNSRLKRVLGWSPRYPDYRAGYAAILRVKSESER